MSARRFLSVLVLPALLAAAPLSAQGTGRIIGRVVDAAGGAPIAGAQIEVVGAGMTAVSALDGRYTLPNVPAGTVSIRTRMIGFQPKVVTGLAVVDGKAVAQDVGMTAAVTELLELTVTAEAERGSVNQALEEQRYSTAIVNAVSAEQIARSPDGDAGAAVQRVSGVTVQDGKYVFVRGLGERYTTTSLNGARIPSPDPERKVVPLDLFPAGLLEGITTAKTFTPEQAGDFSGAQVNLKTREFPAERLLSFSTSFGLNTAVTGRDLLRAPTVGREWLGYAGAERSLPTEIRSADALRPALIGSFRNAWLPRTATGTGNGSFGVSVGGEDPVLGQPIGYIGSFTYGYSQETRQDEVRALTQKRNGSYVARNESRGSTGRMSVLWGGMLNLSSRIGSRTKLFFNNTYNRSADNEATQLVGENEEFDTQLELTRLTLIERSVRSHQLGAEHLLGDRHLIDWSGTVSSVSRHEPDRSDIAYIVSVDPATGGATRQEWFGGPRSATRTFSALDESSADLAANYRIALGAMSNPVFLKVGGLVRTVERENESRPYDITNVGLSPDERRADPASIFSDANAESARLALSLNRLGGRYTADDRLVAGYAQFELPISSRLSLIGGARIERSEVELRTFSESGAPLEPVTPSYTDVLPSLSAIVRLGETQNLRLSTSQTLSRPEYRELSTTSYFEPIGGLITFGNPDLRRALIQNADVRWEWFPRSGEVVSVGAFAKRFQNPIERVLVQQTGASAISFVNARRAYNYGLELEFRKQLDFVAGWLAPFSLFANTTLMQSEIEPGNEDIASFENPERPMVGQSEYVVNTGIGYASESGRWNATLLYNVVGPRITEAGALSFPDSYEQARNVVDLSVQFPVLATMSAKVDAKNLLDEPYEIVAGGVTRLRYRTGRIFSLGLSWTP